LRCRSMSPPPAMNEARRLQEFSSPRSHARANSVPSATGSTGKGSPRPCSCAASRHASAEPMAQLSVCSSSNLLQPHLLCPRNPGIMRSVCSGRLRSSRAASLPCRRSRVRVPSSAPRKAPETGLFSWQKRTQRAGLQPGLQSRTAGGARRAAAIPTAGRNRRRRAGRIGVIAA
jgi:hypothetical protein